MQRHKRRTGGGACGTAPLTAVCGVQLSDNLDATRSHSGILPTPQMPVDTCDSRPLAHSVSRPGAGGRLLGIITSLSRAKSALDRLSHHLPSLPPTLQCLAPVNAPPDGVMFWVLAPFGPTADVPFSAKILPHSTPHSVHVQWMHEGQATFVAYSCLHAPI